MQSPFLSPRRRHGARCVQDTFASGARVPYLPNSARWRSYKKPTISPDPAETPNKRHPQNSLGCKIINTSPAHAHCNYEWPSGTAAPTTPAPSRSPFGHRTGKTDPVVLRRKRMVLRRPLGLGLLVSYLIVLHGSLTLQLLLRLPLLSICWRRNTGP